MKLTKQEMLKLNPCDEGKAFIAKHKTLKSAWIACDNLDWMIWALTKVGLWQDPIAREFACQCAEHTLSIYENKYPGDLRPRLAIQAGRDFTAGKITESARSAAESAAWSARSAAWSAAEYAARSAAESAAWSARSAAWSARSAAESARSAAWSAAEYATETKWQIETLRNLINPFGRNPK